MQQKKSQKILSWKKKLEKKTAKMLFVQQNAKETQRICLKGNTHLDLQCHNKANRLTWSNNCRPIE